MLRKYNKGKEPFQFKNNPKFILYWFLLIIMLLPLFSFSQDYRNARAYILDFGKNEMYIKKSLIDYSITIVESHLEPRSIVTSQKIIDKLQNINSVLKSNDKGFNKDISLRDSFINMNEKTIEYLKNGSLILNDYQEQSGLSFTEILNNLNRRQIEVQKYFDELKKYELIKKEFGLKYNIEIRNYNDKNVFEYNSIQNVVFYKINIIDDKLISLINEKDKNGVLMCLNFLDAIYDDLITKTTIHKNDFSDETLNDATIEYGNFIYSQKQKIVPLFIDYVNEYDTFQKIKNEFTTETPESVTQYNLAVRNYNLKKNLFFDALYETQYKKKVMYNNWFITNGSFLKNNVEFENIHDKYTNEN
jgi:hypothetical protein